MSSLYDRRWRKRRDRQLAAHPLCRLCLELDGHIVSAVIADHIEPHRGDPVKFAGPLQSLCVTHHSGWKQRLEKSGRVLGNGVDGFPLDPNHPWNRGRADRAKGDPDR